jgi:HAD superfamily hydrolase (TIGR01458 family)
MTSPRLDVDGLLLDMDGVLTVSWEPLPGAVEAVRRLHDAGMPMRVLTGTTALSRPRLAEHLRAAGFPFADDEVLAAAVIAAEFLRQHRAGARVTLLGDAQADDLDGVDLVGLDEAPDIVLLSGADDSFRFETFNKVLRLLLGGAELVAMHRNLVWATHEGPDLDTGAYLLGLERAAGCSAVVTGKPAPECFAAGAASLGLDPARVAMVGDDLEGDALGAERAGMTGVLVRTGKFREQALAAAPAPPRYVIDSIAGLPGLLGA